MTLFFETAAPEGERKAVEDSVKDTFKARIGVTVIPKAVAIGDLPRSEKKSTRVFDNRY